MITADQLNQRSAGRLPGLIGIVVTEVSGQGLRAELHVRDALLAPNGYLHAGTLVTLADTLCGYGCLSRLPEGASGFTTVELKSNHLGSAESGTVQCHATPAHLGRSTQVWDAVLTHRDSGRTLALFRCTQMVLYPRA